MVGGGEDNVVLTRAVACHFIAEMTQEVPDSPALALPPTEEYLLCARSLSRHATVPVEGTAEGSGQ